MLRLQDGFKQFATSKQTEYKQDTVELRLQSYELVRMSIEMHVMNHLRYFKYFLFALSQ